MTYQSCGGVRYYQFDSLQADLTHAIFTRQGGVSPEPWASLNLGGTVGDDPQRVRENRLRAFATLGRDPASLYDVWQVHGIEVVIADSPRSLEVPLRQADAILTDKSGITLLMRFADCVPIFLHDPVQKVIGITHSGWQGTVKGTVCSAVRAMQSHYHTDPKNILAAIGPSIGPDHYQIGPDVASQVRQTYGVDSAGLFTVKDGSTFFDLWAANRLHLEGAGVVNIEVAGLCTACHVEDWYSHRFEQGRTGRFGAMIALK